MSVVMSTNGKLVIADVTRKTWGTQHFAIYAGKWYLQQSFQCHGEKQCQLNVSHDTSVTFLQKRRSLKERRKSIWKRGYYRESSCLSKAFVISFGFLPLAVTLMYST